jgi:hypothetical protein
MQIRSFYLLWRVIYNLFLIRNKKKKVRVIIHFQLFAALLLSNFVSLKFIIKIRMQKHATISISTTPEFKGFL